MWIRQEGHKEENVPPPETIFKIGERKRRFLVYFSSCSLGRSFPHIKLPAYKTPFCGRPIGSLASLNNQEVALTIYDGYNTSNQSICRGVPEASPPRDYCLYDIVSKLQKY